MNWFSYGMQLAEAVSKKSKDPSCKVGAVVFGSEHEVLSTGYNGFPIGVYEAKNERWKKPNKYNWIVHAEANAILLAARNGVNLSDSTIYVNKDIICMDCAKDVIQAGIRRVVLTQDSDLSDVWKEESGQNTDPDETEQMLMESGVDIIQVDTGDK